MTDRDDPEPGGALDGRVRRTERSREKMRQAFFELVGEGDLTPTAQQVAERAGVGVRTVFRHFSEMDSLFAEIDEMLRKEALPFNSATPSTGTLVERATELVTMRATAFERFAPYMRSTRINRWRSGFLRLEYAAFVKEQRAALQRWLPELGDAPQDLADAIELSASFESWDRLRTDQRLGAARTLAAMKRSIVALVTQLPR